MSMFNMFKIPNHGVFDLRVTGSILPVVGCEDFGDLPFGGILLVRRLDFG
jgi:hypothetical protein